jgi:hypothetical protein
MSTITPASKFKVGDRVCGVCGLESKLDEYVPNRGAKFGRKNLCLKCSGKGLTAGKFPAGNLLPTVGGCRLSDTSLSVKGDKMTQRAWEAALGRVVRLESGTQWWVGDLVAFGEKRYGETYELALRATSRSIQTLKSYAWVSRKVAPAVRRADLPWRSHRLVAPLPEQEQRRWLGMAAKGGWTSEELDRELRDAGKTGKKSSFDDPDPEVEYRCPSCGHEWAGHDPRPEPVAKGKLKVAA